MDQATTTLCLTAGLPTFYFTFKDNGAVYRGLTKAQRRVCMAGLVMYLIGLCLFAVSLVIRVRANHQRRATP